MRIYQSECTVLFLETPSFSVRMCVYRPDVVAQMDDGDDDCDMEDADSRAHWFWNWRRRSLAGRGIDRNNHAYRCHWKKGIRPWFHHQCSHAQFALFLGTHCTYKVVIRVSKTSGVNIRIRIRQSPNIRENALRMREYSKSATMFRHAWAASLRPRPSARITTSTVCYCTKHSTWTFDQLASNEEHSILYYLKPR